MVLFQQRNHSLFGSIFKGRGSGIKTEGNQQQLKLAPTLSVNNNQAPANEKIVRNSIGGHSPVSPGGQSYLGVSEYAPATPSPQLLTPVTSDESRRASKTRLNFSLNFYLSEFVPYGLKILIFLQN